MTEDKVIQFNWVQIESLYVLCIALLIFQRKCNPDHLNSDWIDFSFVIQTFMQYCI